MTLFVRLIGVAALALTICCAQTTPLITAISSPRQIVPIGGALTLSVAATGATAYQWKKDGASIAGATQPAFSIINGTSSLHDGCYWVEVTGGSASQSITLISEPIFVLCALSDAAVAVWGSNSDGQKNLPPSLGSVVAIAAGAAHALALRQDGTVIGWGLNSAGQASVPSGLRDVVAIAAGSYHSMALRQDGTVVAWGYNSGGQATVPTGLSRIVKIDAGGEHSVALRQDGTVVAWGGSLNSFGQASVPSGLSGVVGISAGNWHTLAIKSDGRVVAWGSNSDGRSSAPPELFDVASVSAGGGHSVASRRDGSVVAWGWDGSGQARVPTPLAGVIAVSAGFAHTLALRADGSLVAWGSNSDGQASAPSTIGKVAAISASSGYFSMALYDGSGDRQPEIVASPESTSFFAGSPWSLTVSATPVFPELRYQWRKDGVPIQGATKAYLAFSQSTVADSGIYDVTVSNYRGSASSSPARVSFTPPPPPSPASVLVQPSAGSVIEGADWTLRISVGGYPIPVIQWFKNGTPIPGETGTSLSLNKATPDKAGDYTASVTNMIGSTRYSITSSIAKIVVVPSSRLSNLSVRCVMGEDQTLIVGAVMSGGPKSLLIRAGGPSLIPFGLEGMLDPRLELFTGGSLPVSSNDDWNASIAPLFQAVGAFGFISGSKDAAMNPTIGGAFTVHTKGRGGGAVLVEAYDLGAETSPRLINLSARNWVGTGADVLIAGFVVSGAGSKQLLIRAVGPTLASLGVDGALSDPQLEVFDSGGHSIGTNDNWSSSLSTTFAKAGAFPLVTGSRDAATLITLTAGASYTVKVSGVNNTTGEALIEIYEVF